MDNKLLQIRTVWDDDNQKININIQKKNISDQEVLGILEMAKHQILNSMNDRTVSEYGNIKNDGTE